MKLSSDHPDKGEHERAVCATAWFSILAHALSRGQTEIAQGATSALEAMGIHVRFAWSRERMEQPPGTWRMRIVAEQSTLDHLSVDPSKHIKDGFAVDSLELSLPVGVIEEIGA